MLKSGEGGGGSPCSSQTLFCIFSVWRFDLSYIFSGGVALTYFSVQKSFELVVVTYGLMFGLGVGIAYAVPINCGHRVRPKCFIVSSFGVSCIWYSMTKQILYTYAFWAETTSIIKAKCTSFDYRQEIAYCTHFKYKIIITEIL